MLLNPHGILSLLSYNWYPFTNVFFSLSLSGLSLSSLLTVAGCMFAMVIGQFVGGWVGAWEEGGLNMCVFGVCVLGGGGVM